MCALRAQVHVAMGVLVLAGVTGCSSGGGGQDVFTGPYAAQIRAAYESASDATSKAALSDGEVTRAEYVSAVDRYVKCVNDQGVDMVAHESYGLFSYEVVGSGADGAMAACDAIVAPIESVYSAILTNPSNEDPYDLIVACLKRGNLAPSDYTTGQFEADLEADAEPFDTSDETFVRCMTNPQAEA